MLSVVLVAPGRLDLVERPEPPAPKRGEALVAVCRVGICGTDHHAFAGRQNFIHYPCVLGHELAIEVLAVGPDVHHVSVGELCAVLPYVACGSCDSCRRGRTNACERLEVLGVTREGGLQEQMVVPADQLFPGDGLKPDQLALVETLGIGWHAVQRARPEAGERVLVLGAGPIGLAVAQAMRELTDQVVIADLVAARRDFAVSQGLTTVAVDADFAEALPELFGGQRPSLVFDATGHQASMERAVGHAATGGRVVFVGHTRGLISIHNPTFHARELEVMASRNATAEDWREVMERVRAGKLDALAWINHRASLESIAEDLPALVQEAGAVVKTVVDVGGCVHA
jgi:2-desacetyl-2-hydroxyethyl bacteriochlorophyllide A dehydrogenase